MINMTKQTYAFAAVAALLLAGGCATEVITDDSDTAEEEEGAFEKAEVELTAGEVSTSQLCVYEHANFQGRAACWGGLRPGEQTTLKDLIGAAVGNDQISSFKVRRGVKVQFFSDVDRKGAMYRVSGYFGKVWDPDLSRGGKPVGNDSISSIVIKATASTAQSWDDDEWQLCLYADADFQGAMQCWGGVPSGAERGQPTIFHTLVGNDRASSYRVNGGVHVTFASDLNLGGTTSVSDGIDGPRQSSNMGGVAVGNDRLSSFMIEPY